MLRNKKYILVMSGGGSKCFYSLGILKAIEELKIDQKIEAIFGVSAGAMIGAYRSAGWSIDDIFAVYLSNIEILSAKNLKLPPVKSLIKDLPVRRMYKKDLPDKFEQLHKKLYIGASDLYSGNYELFHAGELISPLMGSISLPVIFPPVHFNNCLLADGGIIDNFPVLRAKKMYPKHEVIGITVDSFKKNQKVTNILSSAIVSFNLALSKDIEGNIIATDHLFSKDTGISSTETDIKKIEGLYKSGYQDGISYFTAKRI